MANEAYENRYQEKTALMEMLPEYGAWVAKHLAIGTGVHIGANIAIKQLRKSKFGDRLGKKLSDIGARHAAEGRQVHPWILDRVSQTLGPELTADYRTAHKMVKRIGNSGVTPDTLHGANGSLHEKAMGSIHKLPLVGAPLHSVIGRLKNPSNTGKSILDRLTIKDSTLDNMSPRKKKLMEYARRGTDALQSLGTMATGVPGVGDHFLVNAVRSAASRSAKGQEFVKRRFRNGLNGVQEGKIKRWLVEHIISPMAYGESYDLGVAASKHLNNACVPNTLHETLFDNLKK